MKLGVIVPQGWTGEYDGWDPLEAWRRTVAVAPGRGRLGVESIWLFDHFHTIPGRPTRSRSSRSRRCRRWPR
jgi:hypothetical protein